MSEFLDYLRRAEACEEGITWVSRTAVSLSDVIEAPQQLSQFPDWAVWISAKNVDRPDWTETRVLLEVVETILEDILRTRQDASLARSRRRIRLWLDGNHSVFHSVQTAIDKASQAAGDAARIARRFELNGLLDRWFALCLERLKIGAL
ncbi:MAG: hypothetical protein AAF483_26745 [Planctomycetota bacterium]